MRNSGPKALQFLILLSPLAVRTRLELATPCVTGRYSNQLNYRTSFCLGVYFLAFAVQSYGKIFDSANFLAIIFEKKLQFSAYKSISS